MRYVDIYLKGYIGVLNGTHRKEIFIDLSKSMNKIIVIKGKNGGGKSSIMKTINLYPDSNSFFIPNEEAEKSLTINDNGIIYKIKIIHGIKNNGDRETTKAYIQKITENETLQLNPNGNVSSYKEVLSTEFNLDPNFDALSFMSSYNRGLADMRPAERKKFINSIVSNLETYNNINKTMTKRSSIFRSMINSLISKIDNIGEEEKLVMLLKSLEDRANTLLNKKEQRIEILAEYKSKIKLLDPDGSIQLAYEKIYNELIELNKKIDIIRLEIDKFASKLKTTNEDIMDKYNDLKNICTSLEMNIKINQSNINNILLNKEQEAKRLSEKSAKLESIKLNIDYNLLSTEIEKTKNKINEYKTIIDKIGIDNIGNISKEEFIIGLESLKEIKDNIDNFKSSGDYEIMKQAILYCQQSYYPDINVLEQKISAINTALTDTKVEYQKYQTLSQIASKLSLRPKHCKIDNCEFIKDALEADSCNPVQRAKDLEKLINEYEKELEQTKKEKSNCTDIIEYINYLKVIIRNITKNISIINKLPVNINIFANKSIIFKAILDGYDFNEIDTLYSYIDYANIIEEYKTELNKYSTLMQDNELYSTKNKIVEELFAEIDDINKSMKELEIKIDNSNNVIIEDKKQLSINKSLLLDYEHLIELYANQQQLNNSKEELKSRYGVIKDNMANIKQCIDSIKILENELLIIDKEIKPILDDRDTIKHNILLLQEYNMELSSYQAKAEKINTIKKYSSPSTGIQLIFMELYMNKTLSLANELLALLFDGEYTLSNFEINEDGFSIPCIGSGLRCDDISSMSTSQICMISMILSFVLLYQSSTSYNILKLDEIDSGLDTTNRLLFLSVLDKIMEILNVEQCFMISHNNELDMSNADIIQLDNNDGQYQNVIFKL